LPGQAHWLPTSLSSGVGRHAKGFASRAYEKTYLIRGFYVACLLGANGVRSPGQGSQLGLFRFSGKEEIVKSPETTSGVTRVAPGTPILVASTNRVPAKIGVRFGMSYEIVNVAASDGEIKVTKIARHPKITKPDGTVSEGFTFSEPQWIKGGRVVGWTGYGFDHDYELATGDWEFEMQLEGKTLLKQRFSVFKE